MVSIRRVSISDYKDIYMLNKELGYLYEEEKVRKKIKYIIENKKDIILVAYINNNIIGYIHGSEYELLYSDSLINILGFVVKESYRKNGVGTALIDKLEEIAIEKKYSGIRLVSGIDREDAHRFYERNGYIYRKEQKNFIKLFS
ncbi:MULTISPECIES: GNAT family N-acetyltransferase [Clostridium]|jgi:ribosomal protein S18 acetylase RimI-like enzyme|uniref:GNAT family N-acetyltransferase n=1 Tax=Clostridium TaxID=1485 RepID=UPI000C08DAAC|nr:MULTISPECIES: GNAT family N-acetyltransferase [Clostridium]MBU6135598.1 GNAT family N-acetyltransferase [Clostridium tertium]MDB1946981.1 GNAT family N-acetyltransferase [Clostridium tertium]MDI9215431.1 GNAT family N-acetyltransferase [Clostridium tertium]MDU2683485.1 GNAT family N-acetyltransferase [Clostridium sp.]MDU8964295.1 GNAT family N-acetyltransferase [Clostridium sp.]